MSITSTLTSQPVVCIGSVLWDIVGRSKRNMALSHDVPGHIERRPGGVALNIAMALASQNLPATLLSAVGQDFDGDTLIDQCRRMGLGTEFLYRPKDLPTDQYMAIEAENGLVAAIADAHSLERAGDHILAPLTDGRLGSADIPYTGLVALDGNLTAELLGEISQSPLLRAADLRIAPASPGKAERLLPFLHNSRGTLYVNLIEAEILCQEKFENSALAAAALLTKGVERVLVTDGGRDASFADADTRISRTPPAVTVTRITGAGDTFMAAHIAAETTGAGPDTALERALDIAARYVSEGSH